jgi:3-isopropylmalate/(R)-2-methylmalate dehydratase small subunit
VDLEQQTLRLPDGREQLSFDVEDYRRQCLLEGLDDIGVTLKSADAIRAYEAPCRAFTLAVCRPGRRRDPARTAVAR